jgi:tetrahydromethanopterin S-methyltransferase subunit G
MRISDYLQAISDRLDRLDAKVDERFATVDVRFSEVDRRFEQIDRRFEQVDRRFDEQRAHTNALYEASRADYNNLYDFVIAQAERTDARFEESESRNAARFADLQTAIAALAPRARGARRGR